MNDALLIAAQGVSGLTPGVLPVVFARAIVNSLVLYEVCFAIEEFADAFFIQSDVVKCVVNELNRVGIPIGEMPTEVRLLSRRERATPAS